MTMTIATLKARIRQLEGSGTDKAGSFQTGLSALDAVLPGGGLRRGALHEIVAAEADWAAAQGFATLLLARLDRSKPILWCGSRIELCGSGLAALGFDPTRLILVRANRPADLLWALEEGLRTPALAAVVGEPRLLDLTVSRRLQLAAETSGVTGLMLRSGTEAATSVASRWQVASAAGSRANLRGDELGFSLLRARWMVALLRCRGAVPTLGEVGHGRWLIEIGDPPHASAIGTSAEPSSADVPMAEAC